MSEMIQETAPAVEAPTAEPAAEEQAWAGPSQEEWQQVVQGLGYLSSVIPQTQPEPQPQPQEQRPQFDPFSDDPTAQLDAYIEAKLAPVRAYQQYEQLAESEERVYDILDDFTNSKGGIEIENKEKVFPMLRSWADANMQEAAQKYGFGPRAAEAALEQAYDDFQAILEAHGKTAVARHMNQLTNLGNARAEPPTFPGSAQAVEIQAGGDELDLVRKYGGMVPGHPGQ